MKINILFVVILLFSTKLGNSQDTDYSWSNQMFEPTPNLNNLDKSFKSNWNGKSADKGNGKKPYNRWLYNISFYQDSTGQVSYPKNLIQEIDFKFPRRAESKSNNQWSYIGPTDVPTNNNGKGRINVVAFHPSNPNKIWAGAPAGGLWYSFDKGSTWTTYTDQFENLGVSDIVFDPVDANTMYIASGDRDGGDTRSYGILKSTNGGFSWALTNFQPSVNGIGYFSLIHRILIDPSNNQNQLVATNIGIYQSVDGGNTWSQTITDNIRHMERHPTNPQILYGSTDQNNPQGPNAEFYRSNNGGATWTKINIPDGQDLERLAIGTCSSAPNIVYLLASSNVGSTNFHALYKSTNSGQSFNQVVHNSYPNLGNQEWYDWMLIVNPNDPNDIYIGGVSLYRSINGGVDWTWASRDDQNNFMHVDHHYGSYQSLTGDAYFCNDGGLFRKKSGTNVYELLSSDIHNTQYYRISNAETNADYIIGGSQDNGTHELESGIGKWITGGDGMDNEIDYTNENIVYTSSQYGNFFKSTDQGNTFNNMINSGVTGISGSWVTPLKIDPNNPNNLFALYDKVWKSTDQGTSWTSISPSFANYSLRTFDIAKSNSDYIYVKDDTKNLMLTTDGGVNWTPKPIPTSSVYWIEINPINEEHIWIGGYYGIYESFDAGNSWSNISENLEGFIIRTICADENSNQMLYVGTDFGVFYRSRQDKTWYEINNNLPRVIISEIDIIETTGQLRIGTYGRGIWEADLPNSPNGSCTFTSALLTDPDTCTSTGGDYTLLLDYQNIPDAGGLLINASSYDVTGSTQEILLSASNNQNITIQFEDQLSCSTNIQAPASCSCTDPEQQALVALYLATDGTNWTNNSGWTDYQTDCDPCSWYGVSCNQYGQVTNINLYNNNLSGIIPADLSQLTELSSLQLGWNQLTGNIPAQFSNLTKLRSLYLYQNQLSGSIPTAISSLPLLNYINLRNNQFSGTIPNWIFDLSELISLELSNNQLTGSIPNSIGNASLLNYLNLGGNQLSGQIPSTITSANQLRTLYLYSNDLTGTIPNELGDMPNLEIINISSNDLSGCFPNNLQKFYDSSKGYFFSNPQLPFGGDLQMAMHNESGFCDADLCNDGYQSLGEIGIDCGGGSCQPCACVNSIEVANIYHQSFENDTDPWIQNTLDGKDWTHAAGYRYRGPSAASDGSNYIFVQNQGFYNKKGAIESPCIDISELIGGLHLNFAYHMSYTNVDSLKVSISEDQGNTWYDLIQIVGSQGAEWLYSTIDLSNVTSDYVKLRFTATTGTDYWNTIAIDDIGLYKVCADHVLISNPVTYGYNAEANLSITANSTINTNQIVKYDAGQSINLNAGFEVKPNTSFIALIDGCANNGNEGN